MPINFGRPVLLFSLIGSLAGVAMAQPASAPPSPPDWARTTYVMAPPSSSSFPHVQVEGGGSCPKPEYPMAAVRANAQGVTGIHLKIDAGGHVLDREIVQASGATPAHRLLDIALDRAFRDCEFPVASQAERDFTLHYAWRLE